MRTKVLTLGLICFFVFAYCKKNLPTSPDLPDSLTINYFTAIPEQILCGEYSTLYWSTSNALKVEINQGIGEVSAIGTMKVSPVETTIYRLTACDGIKTAFRRIQVTVVLSMINK